MSFEQRAGPPEQIEEFIACHAFNVERKTENVKPSVRLAACRSSRSRSSRRTKPPISAPRSPRSPGPTSSSSSIPRAPTTPWRSRGGYTDRVVVRDVARLRRAEELRGVARQPRLDSVARRRRARHAGAGRGNPADAAAGTRARGFRIPRVDLASRPLDPHDRLVSRLPAAALRSAAPREWTGRYVHEAVPSTASSAGCAASFSTSPTATSPTTSRRSIATRRYAARQMHEDGRRAGLLQLAGHPPLAFLRNYLAQAAASATASRASSSRR